MAVKPNTAVCPYCNRQISTCNNRYARHTVTPDGDNICPLTDQRIPITGTTATDYTSRANLVCNLAVQVQDEDPHNVWQYLTSTPAEEIQRLLMIALAAIPVDRRIDQLFHWVYDLPVAKEAC